MQWDIADAEIKIPSVANFELSKVLHCKPRVCQNRAMHASLTARDSFLSNFYLSCPFSSICSKPSHHFFLTLCLVEQVATWAHGIRLVTLLYVTARQLIQVTVLNARRMCKHVPKLVIVFHSIVSDIHLYFDRLHFNVVLNQK